MISTINSLTLSPALAALLLKPRHAKRDPITVVVDFLFGWLFRLFSFGFKWSTSVYTRLIARLLRVPAMVLIVYCGLVLLTGWGYRQLPTGFIPGQDKGYLILSLQLPDAASAERTREVVSKVEQLVLSTPGVKGLNSIAGNSFILSAYGSNFGSMFLHLKSFEERTTPDLYSEAIVANLRGRLQKEIPEAQLAVFAPPAVSGLGRAGGFRFMVEDRGDVGLKRLQERTDRIVAEANQQPGLLGLFTVYNANSPQLFIDIDREQCIKQGVALADVFGTLQAFLGSRYVNDFNRFGRTWQVVVQADETFRNQLDDVKKLKVRNHDGKMVPIGSVATVKEVSGPLVLTRYNMYPAAAINGMTPPGFSTGQSIAALESVALRELPSSMSFEWTEITYLERNAAQTGMYVFLASAMFVFLVLAALYESWSLPLAVILVVPMCVLCSIAGVWMAQQDINVFTQIGFVVLIGLACKNAILIVEFAKLRRDEGMDRTTATLQACELRLRPILMTSFAFILGVVPLVASHGAGAEMRRALGTAVFSGMLGVTVFGVLLTPVFFFVIDAATSYALHSHPWLHRLGAILLDLVRFRHLRLGAVAVSRWVSEKSKRGGSATVSSNGAAPHRPNLRANDEAGTGPDEVSHEKEATVR